MAAVRPRHRLGATAGLLVGLAVAAVLVSSWRLPSSGGALGADVDLVATPPGELGLRQTGAFLRARDLEPGDPPAEGELKVRNVAGGPVSVRLRPRPSDPRLWRLLRFETDGARLIPRGAERTLRARVWLPPHAGHGWEARATQVTLELRARPVRRSR